MDKLANRGFDGEIDAIRTVLVDQNEQQVAQPWKWNLNGLRGVVGSTSPDDRVPIEQTKIIGDDQRSPEGR